ncbi:MAG: hypothetical protein JST01_03180 [Cyanobacteria bacterium SZAS TMP-1]|nr:hypothetical protein [Cyanobacteria bacterium SZAS TMP-1]
MSERMRQLRAGVAISSGLLINLNAGLSALAATADSDIQQMSRQYKLGRYVLAENLGREILRRDPTNLDVRYLLGNIYYKLDDISAARDQYTYCVNQSRQTHRSLAAARLAGAALSRMASGTTSNTTDASAPSTAAGPTMNVSPTVLKEAESILQKADADLLFKRRQLETVVGHTEEFASSRIKEIPLNTIHRRMSAFSGIQASRDNEDYFTAPNHDRPGEIAQIRATETAKINKLIEEYNTQTAAIITAAMKQVDALLGAQYCPTGTTGEQSPAAPQQSGARAEKTIDAFTVCGITTRHLQAGHKVIVVATGSAAHRAGLATDDIIEQSTFIPAADLLKVTIKRGDKHYSLTMHPDAASLASQKRTGKKTAVASKPSSREEAWARIKDSDIIFVQDMSSNMASPLGDTGLQKWDWCAARILDFADSISKNNSKYFGLMQCYQYAFNSYKDLSVPTLKQLLANSIAMESAVLTAPLQQLAYDHLTTTNAKPLLILVFTTGKQERGDALEAAIKTILDHVKSPDQARLIFFQIGEDPVGTATLKMLDQDLTYAGYKYDIVDWVKFEDLQTLGLSRAILEAYESPRDPGTTQIPPKPMILSDRLAAIRKQAAALAKN